MHKATVFKLMKVRATAIILLVPSVCETDELGLTGTLSAR